MAKGNSITEQILTQLRSDIVNCYYDAHALITEGEVSERFQVSKTPAREALNYLCQEGLVEKLPHRGYLVKGFSMRDLERKTCRAFWIYPYYQNIYSDLLRHLLLWFSA